MRFASPLALSRGLRGDLVPLGKLTMILLMFIGWVGLITFGLAVFNQTNQKTRFGKYCKAGYRKIIITVHTPSIPLAQKRKRKKADISLHNIVS